MEEQRQKAETFLKSLPDLSQKICRLWPPGVVSVSAEPNKHLNELTDGVILIESLPCSMRDEYKRKAGEVLVNSGLISLLCEKATPGLENKQGGDVTHVIGALKVCTVGTLILLKKDGDLHRLLPLLVNLLKDSFVDHMAGTLQQGGDSTLKWSLGVIHGLAQVEENKQHLRALPNIYSVVKAYSRSENAWIYFFAVVTMARLETERRADTSSPNHDTVQFLLGQMKALEREGFNPHDIKLSGVFEAVNITTWNAGNIELLVQQGVLPYLEKVLVKCVSKNKCKEWSTSSNIVITLQNLACAERNKAEIMKHKQLLDSLVSISIDQSHSHRPDCIEWAKDALSKLGMNPQDMQNGRTRHTGLLDMSSDTEDSGRQIPMSAPQRMDIMNNGLTSSFPNGSPNLIICVKQEDTPHSGLPYSLQPGNMTGNLTPWNMPPVMSPGILNNNFNAALHGGMSNNIPPGIVPPVNIQGLSRLSDAVPTSSLAPGGMLTNMHPVQTPSSGMPNNTARNMPGNCPMGSMSNALQTDSGGMMSYSDTQNIVQPSYVNLGNPNSNGNLGNPNSNGNLGNLNSNGNLGNLNSNGNLGNLNSNGNLGNPNSNGNLGNPNSNGNIGNPNSNGNLGNLNSNGNLGNLNSNGNLGNPNSNGTPGSMVHNLPPAGLTGNTNHMSFTGATDGEPGLVGELRREHNMTISGLGPPQKAMRGNAVSGEETANASSVHVGSVTQIDGKSNINVFAVDAMNGQRSSINSSSGTGGIPNLPVMSVNSLATITTHTTPSATNYSTTDGMASLTDTNTLLTSTSTLNSQLASNGGTTDQERIDTDPSNCFRAASYLQMLCSTRPIPLLWDPQAANSPSNSQLFSPDIHEARDPEARTSTGSSTSQQRLSSQSPCPSCCNEETANRTPNSRISSPDRHDARNFKTKTSTGPGTSQQRRSSQGPSPSLCHPQAASSTSNQRLPSPDRDDVGGFELRKSSGPSNSQQRRSNEGSSPSLFHSPAVNSASHSRLCSPDIHDARNFEPRKSTGPSTSQQRLSSQGSSPSLCHSPAANSASHLRLCSPDIHDSLNFEPRKSIGPSTSQQRRSSQGHSPSLRHPQAASSTSNQRLPSPDRHDVRDFELRESSGPGTSQQRPESRSSRHSSPENSGNHTPSSTSSSRSSSADSTSEKDSSDDELSRSSSPVTVQRQSRSRRRTPYRRTPSHRMPLALRNKFRPLQPESVTVKNQLGGETSKTSHPGSFQQRCNPQGRSFRPSATVSRRPSTPPCTLPPPAFSTTSPVPPTVSFSARGLNCCLYLDESQPRTSGSSRHCSDRWQLVFSNESQPSEYRHPPSTTSYLPRSSGKQENLRSPDPDEDFNDFQPLSQQNPGLHSHVPDHQAFSSWRPQGNAGLSPMDQGSFSSGPRQRRKRASGVKAEAGGLHTHSRTSASLSRANEMTCEQYLLCPECGLSYTSQNNSRKGRGKRRNQSECPDCQPSHKYSSSVKKRKSHSIPERKHGNALPSKTCGLSSESKHSTYNPQATVTSAEYKPCIASGMFRNSDSSARPFSKAKTKHSKHSLSRSCGPAGSCHEIQSKSSDTKIQNTPLVKAEHFPQTSKQFLKTEPNDSTTFQHQECIASNKPWTENVRTKQQKDTRVKRKCPHCSEDFVSAEEFLLHMKHNKHFKCRECVKCFAYKKTLAKHVKDKHDPENQSSYKCVVCDKEFGCERYLKEHEKVHGEHAFERYKCGKCEKGFPYRSVFNKHIKLCR